jgi:signal transduction histidine kinase
MSGSPERAQLERELAFYKTEYNELGARLLRLQEEHSRVAREARRSRIVARLVRDAYQIVNRDIEAEAVGGQILSTVADTAICDRAVLLRAERSAPNIFHVEYANGTLNAGSLRLHSPPAFLFTAAGCVPTEAAAALADLVGLPYIIWAHDAASGHAILLAKRSEANIHRPFEAGDREIVEVALAVYMDVLLRKRAELTLRQAKRAAEEANEARARFLANLSHELRTPLSAIIGFSELLLRDKTRLQPAAQREEFAQQILAAGRDLLSLSNDILDSSRLANASPHLRLDWVPLEQLLQTSLRGFHARALEHHNQLEGPPVLPGLEVAIDYDRFRQVLSNLIGNAIKFTPGGGTIAVSGALTSEGAVEISVHDTGIGIRPEDIARVFEPFVQLQNNVTHSRHGAGLGLSIAKQLVEAHEGELRIDSVYGAGTVVTITLPPARARQAQAMVCEALDPAPLDSRA